jgi:hypothetical protein
MKTTFLNCRKEDRKNFRNEARAHMKSRAEDFKFFMNHGTDRESTNIEDEEEADRLYNEHGNFYDYGLSVDYVAPHTFERQREGYFRYQLSYGGPSEEIRFYYSPRAREAYKIEFVYLQWGTGAGFNVTNEDWTKWLFDWFNEVGTIEAEQVKALEA